MKTFAMTGTLAAMLLGAGAATAQELPPQAQATPAQDAAPITGEAAAVAFTDAEIASFVEAAIAMRAAQAELAGDAGATAETRQAKAMEVLGAAGIAPATYNAIGEAMQSDPALAQRVQLALGARTQAADPDS